MDEGQKSKAASYNDTLHVLQSKIISISTVYRWLCYLGFKYNENKQNYCTNGHERDDVVKDRDERFLTRYFDSELLAHQWVQIPSSVASNLEAPKVLL